MKKTTYATLALSLLFVGCGDDETTTTTVGDAGSSSSTTAGTSVSTTVTTTTAGTTTAGTTTAGTTTMGTTTDATGDTGMTTGLLCTPPEEDCGGVCVDTTMSLEHCGMCDHACEMGDACMAPDCTGSRELIMNGDFAVAALADWTTANNPDEVANCPIPDDTVIVFGEAVGGGYADHPDSTGPNAHVLYQDFTVPVGVSAATLSFDYAMTVPGGGTLDPINVQTIIKDCLDDNGDGNAENALRVDIIDPAADQFLAPILFEVATPDMTAGDPTVPTFVNIANSDAALLTFLQGQEGNTLRLRVAQVESTFLFPVALDNFSLAVDLVY